MPATFPPSIKPIVSQGYSFNAPANVLEQTVAGGLPLMILDFKTASVAFDVVLLLDALRLAVWMDFYFAVVNSGSANFYMNLDSGFGIQQHVCKIVPSSVGQQTSDTETWTVTFTLLAENTPAQFAPFEGNLVALFNEYGDDLPIILDRLAIFTLSDMPEVFAP